MSRRPPRNRRTNANRRANTIRRRPYHYGFGIPAILVTVVLFFFLYQATNWNPYGVWLVVINLTTGVIFVLDKFLSRTGTRIPEQILHLFTLAGGVLGQLLGRVIVDHKTNFQKHPSFTVILVVSLVIHSLLIAYWFF